MKTLFKNKIILLVVAVLVIAMFLYNTIFNTADDSLLSESSAVSVGDDLLKINEELKKVTLDSSLFSSAGFMRLIDFSTQITPQATGRTNPFNTIGRE